MARNFAADSDALHDIAADHYTFPSGPTSVGCWVNQTSYIDLRAFVHVNKWGSSDATQLLAMDYGAGDRRMNGELGAATSAQAISTNATNAATGIWQLWVLSTDGTLTIANWTFYQGSLTWFMRDVMGGTHQAGSGTVPTGGVRLVLGNYWALTGGCRASIAEAFVVPYKMTWQDCERLRQGDWDVLNKGGTPVFFYPLVGSSLTDVATSQTLTAVGTTVVGEPRTGFNGGFPGAYALPLLRDTSRDNTDPWGTSTFTSASSTPTSTKSRLVVFVTYETNNTNTTPDITISDSAGHTWRQEILSLGNTAVTTWGQSVAIFTAPNTALTAFTVSVAPSPSTAIATWKIHVIEVVGKASMPTVRQVKGLAGAQRTTSTITLDSTPTPSSLVLGGLSSDEDANPSFVSGNRIEIMESDVSPVLNTQTNDAVGQTTTTWTTGNFHTVGAAIEILGGRRRSGVRVIT
jgi:hypothetical protein